MKVDYEELINYYNAIRHGKPGDGEYEDAIEAIINAIPELAVENQVLQKRVRELTQQRDWLVKKCKDLFAFPC